MIKNKWQYVAIAILIVLLVSEVIWYSPYTHPKEGSFCVLDVVQNSEGGLTNVTITYQLNANLPLDVTVLVTPVKAVPPDPDLPIYVFYDKNYPTVGTDWILSAMLQAHLKAELYLRGYSAEVRLADAEELEDILSKNESAIVIMASGAFPSNIFSKKTNLVKPWIKSGGILIWFGWFPGWYSVEKGQGRDEIKDDMPQNLRQDGPSQLGLEGLFEFVVLNKSLVVAEEHSPLSELIDTTYNLIHQAPLLDRVDAKSGLALGKTGGEPERLRSSISMIPVGEGEIIIFGFFLRNSLVLNGPEKKI